MNAYEHIYYILIYRTTPFIRYNHGEKQTVEKECLSRNEIVKSRFHKYLTTFLNIPMVNKMIGHELTQNLRQNS